MFILITYNQRGDGACLHYGPFASRAEAACYAQPMNCSKFGGSYEIKILTPPYPSRYQRRLVREETRNNRT